MKKLLGILLAVFMVFAVGGQATASFEVGNLMAVFYNADDKEVAVDLGVFTDGDAITYDTGNLLSYFSDGITYEDINVGIFASRSSTTYSNYWATTEDADPGLSIPNISAFTGSAREFYTKYDYADADGDGIIVFDVAGYRMGYHQVMNSNGTAPGIYCGINMPSWSIGEATLDENGDFTMYLHNYEIVTYEGSTMISTVPVPAAVWLLGSGLLGLIGVRRKKA